MEGQKNLFIFRYRRIGGVWRIKRGIMVDTVDKDCFHIYLGCRIRSISRKKDYFSMLLSKNGEKLTFCTNLVKKEDVSCDDGKHLYDINGGFFYFCYDVNIYKDVEPVWHQLFYKECQKASLCFIFCSKSLDIHKDIVFCIAKYIYNMFDNWR